MARCLLFCVSVFAFLSGCEFLEKQRNRSAILETRTGARARRMYGKEKVPGTIVSQLFWRPPPCLAASYRVSIALRSAAPTTYFQTVGPCRRSGEALRPPLGAQRLHPLRPALRARYRGIRSFQRGTEKVPGTIVSQPRKR
jgi:hypothetical protein